MAQLAQQLSALSEPSKGAARHCFNNLSKAERNEVRVQLKAIHHQHKTDSAQSDRNDQRHDDAQPASQQQVRALDDIGGQPTQDDTSHRGTSVMEQYVQLKVSELQAAELLLQQAQQLAQEEHDAAHAGIIVEGGGAQRTAPQGAWQAVVNECNKRIAQLQRSIPGLLLHSELPPPTVRRLGATAGRSGGSAKAEAQR